MKNKIVFFVFGLIATLAHSTAFADEHYRVCEGGRCGEWIIFHSSAAPFPHPHTDKYGYDNASGRHFGKEFFQDDRVAMFVPERAQQSCAHVDAVVYFHGVNNNVDKVRTHARYRLGEKILRANACAVVIVPQGPLNIWGHFWGKMEDEGGLKNLLNACLRQMGTKYVSFTHLIVSGQSGGFQGVGKTVKKGGVRIDAVFIFDALYALQDNIRDWLVRNPLTFIYGAHTKHLSGKYDDLERDARKEGVAQKRIRFIPADVIHPEITGRYFEEWIRKTFSRLHST